MMVVMRLAEAFAIGDLQRDLSRLRRGSRAASVILFYRDRANSDEFMVMMMVTPVVSITMPIIRSLHRSQISKDL
jgi:hypothetical protein